MRDWKLSRAVSILRFCAEVDDADDERGEDDPRELVPVEEWEAEQGGVHAVVEAGKGEREVRQDEEQCPGVEAAALGCGGSCHRLRRAGPRMGSQAPSEMITSNAAKTCMFITCEQKASTF